jgi:ANTAR domain-containing protein/GAF domain-containing protein
MRPPVRGFPRRLLAVDVPNRQVAEAFVELADTVGGDFDLPAYADLVSSHTVDLLGARAAGIILADPADGEDNSTTPAQLHLLLDSRAVQIHEGAGFECFATGLPVRCHDLAAAGARWPGYAPAARAAGFDSVYAFPMQRERAIGALEVFAGNPVGLGDDDIALGQALADMAAAGILHERTTRSRGVLINQLQTALDSRVAIEQAKGVLAARHEIDVDDAFTALRQYARSHNQRLLDVARTVVTSRTMAAEVLTARRPQHPDAQTHPR